MEISLALGGGGVKGIAHIGVLSYLEMRGFKIWAVAGTSAGGIVAAIYAAGYTPSQMIDYVKKIDQSAMYRRQRGDGPSIFGVAGLTSVLNDFLGDRLFSDLKIPCALSAVDLVKEEEVVMQQGKVIDAVLASIALPGIFPPHIWEGRQLIDGGLLDPVPVCPARSLAPGLPVVAVILSCTDPQPINYLEPPSFLPSRPILRQFARLRLGQAFNIFIHSMDIASRNLTIMRLKLDQPDVIIQPDLRNIGILDRVNPLEIVERGEAAAEFALPQLMRAISWSKRVRRFLKSKQK